MSTAPRVPSATASPAPGRRTAAAVYPVAPGSVAPVGNRVLAYALDGMITVAAVAIGIVMATALASPTSSSPSLLLPAALGLAVVVGQWVAESFSGVTLGNAVTGIRTVSAATGRPAGLLAILLRHLVIAAGALVLLVGQWVVVSSGAWDRSPAQRGWHDKAAGTLVLRAGDVRRATVAGPTSAAPGRDTPLVRAGASDPRTSAGATGLATGDQAGVVRPAPAPVTAHAPLTAPVPVSPYTPTTARPATAPAPTRASMRAPAPETAPVPLSPYTPATALPSRPDPQPVAPLIEDLPGGAPGRRAASTPPPVIDVPPRTGATLPEGGHASAPPARPAPAGVRLRFDTGEVLDVTGDGLVGRRPTAEAGTTHVIAIDDPDRSISRVHLAFGPEPGGALLWVVDRGSTNGTVLVGPDGAGAALPPGTRAVVEAGWVVRFGRRSMDVLER